MLGLKLQLSDALKVSENTTFVFNTRTNLSPRQHCCSAGPPQLLTGNLALPCCQQGGTTGSTSSTSSSHLNMLPAGRREENPLQKKEQLKEGQMGNLRCWRVRRQHQTLFPQQGFPPSCSHCSSHFSTPATGTSTLQLQHLFLLHGSMLPSLPWLSPTPFPSENHRQRGQLDQNLNQ